MSRKGWDGVQARYEIYATTDGRETLEGCVAEKGPALATAETLLAKTPATHARVVEIKSGWTGREYEKDIFAAKADKPAEAPVNVPGAVDDVGLCRDVEDLFALPARLAAGQVARRYLDHHGLTVTEILHSAREMRRIGDADMLVSGAIGRIAARQVELYGGEAGERIGTLTAAFDAAAARARDLDLPRAAALDQDGLAAFLQRLSGPEDAPERVYRGRLGIARALVTIRSLPTKLDVMLGWLAEPVPAEAVRLVDGFLADILVSGKVVRETLGARANLAEALRSLLDLAEGSLDIARPGTEPQTVALNTAFATHPLPDSRAVLVERVRRAVAGTQRLTKEAEGAAGEDAAFKRLIARICTPAGPLGGAGMAEALVQRYGRQRGKPAAVAVPFAIQSIGNCFPGAWDEIVFLTTLLAGPSGRRHLPTVLAALDGCLDEGGSLDRIMWTVRDPDDRLRRIQAFHRLVTDLAIPQDDKVRIAQWIEHGLIELTKAAPAEPVA